LYLLFTLHIIYLCCRIFHATIFDKNVANKKAHNKAQGVDSKKQQEEFKQGWIIARNYQE